MPEGTVARKHKSPVKSFEKSDVIQKDVTKA